MSFTPETLRDGTKINIGIGPSSVHTVNGTVSAYFELEYPDEPPSQVHTGFWLSPGQSQVVGGRYRFAVLRIWADDGAGDAADVRVTGTG
jgi:hypothetical protein